MLTLADNRIWGKDTDGSVSEGECTTDGRKTKEGRGRATKQKNNREEIGF
jgi:hypothetical protein